MANISLQILDSFAFTLESVKYAEAARHYYEQLAGRRDDGENEKCLNNKTTTPLLASSSSPTISPSSTEGKSNNKSALSHNSKKVGESEPEPRPKQESKQPEPPSQGGLSSLSAQIAKAREQIQASLQGSNFINNNSSIPLGSGAITEEDLAMREENTKLKKQVDDLENQVKQLKDRVTKLELAVGKGGSVTAPQPLVKSGGDNKAAADDDDVDLFGSEEEDEEAVKVKEQRLAEYAAKKSKKPALVAKSNVILDVKPWDDETKMEDLEKAVRTIEMDGLLWGASKLVPLAYGIKKLQIATVIEDDKVSVDELTEKIEAFEDYVQSVDIAAFNKI